MGSGAMTDRSEMSIEGDRLAYSVDEVARITGLSRDLLYDQMRIGKLVYLKVGRRRIITRQHLEAFLSSGLE
jgi:excisionase family DNA binding protein